MLVFLSGMNEIASLLSEVKAYGEATGRWIGLPLHSALSIEEQDKVRRERRILILFGSFLYKVILNQCTVYCIS